MDLTERKKAIEQWKKGVLSRLTGQGTLRPFEDEHHLAGFSMAGFFLPEYLGVHLSNCGLEESGDSVTWPPKNA